MYPNIKYELQGLEEIFSGRRNENMLDKSRYKNRIQTVKEEIDRIKQTLVHEVFTFEDERHLERYIQYHQQALIRLMDKAESVRISFDTKSAKQIEFHRTFYEGLEELLSYIERHFTKYFDQDAKAPEGYISIARKKAKLNARKLRKILTEKKVDLRIIDLFLHVLQKMAASEASQNISYRKVMYTKELQKEIFHLLDKQSGDLDEELRQIMYYLNYNSIKVLTYHAHYITALLDEAETRSEKLEKLSFVLKKINQTQVKPGIHYNLFGASLKDQLNNYITEEIDHQERLQQLSGNSPEKQSDSLLKGFKIKFEASVSQLAYLLKILIETKIILNNNLSQIIHFLVKYVITKRAETISYGSFRSKFYSVETGTRESVKSMLLSLIHHIDRT